MALTDSDVLREVQFHLLEDPGAVFSSGLWTAEEFRAFLAQRIQSFQRQVPLTFKRTQIQVPQGVRLADLPTDWIQTAQLYRAGVDGTGYEVARGSAWEIDCTIGRINQGRPLVYNDTEHAPLQLSVGPAPSDQGELDILYAGLGAVLDGVGDASLDELTVPLGMSKEVRNRLLDLDLMDPSGGVGNLLVLPDEFVPYLKWGVLADLLGKIGRGQDPGRAAYCESRFEEGILLAHILMRGWA